MIQPCELPGESLLRKFRDAGAYADCYVTDIAREVSQAQFIEAFYTTWPFKLERLLLGWIVSKPSTDAQAASLARGQLDYFAAWRVEGRTADQFLMCDYLGRTRSWLMSAAAPGDGAGVTRLYFGSAVVPVRNPQSGRDEMGIVFRALMGFHKVYSRVLLHSAKARLLRTLGSQARKK